MCNVGIHIISPVNQNILIFVFKYKKIFWKKSKNLFVSRAAWLILYRLRISRDALSDQSRTAVNNREVETIIFDDWRAKERETFSYLKFFHVFPSLSPRKIAVVYIWDKIVDSGREPQRVFVTQRTLGVPPDNDTLERKQTPAPLKKPVAGCFGPFFSEIFSSTS